MNTPRNCIRSVPLLFAVIIVMFLACAASAAEKEAPARGDDKELEYAEKLFKDGLYEVARGELSRFTGQDTPAGLRQRAFILLGDIESAVPDYVKARKMYESAYEADPKGENACGAMSKLGEATFLLKDYKGAAAVLERLPALFPDCPSVCQSMLDVGRARFEMGDYEQAVRDFEKTRSACGAAAEDPNLLLWLGKAQYELDPAKGRQTFETIVNSHAGTPAAFEASLRLAEELERQGNSEASVGMLERALKYKKIDKADYAVGLSRYAALLASAGRPKEAGRAFSQCFEMSPDSSLCERCNLGAQQAFLSAEEFGEADAVAQKLISGSYSSQGKDASLLTRAAAARAKGDLQGALMFLGRLKTASRVDSLYCLARIEEADARERLSDFAGAESSYLQAMKHSCPESLRPRLLLGLAELYRVRMSDADRASLYYGLLVRQYPGAAEAATAARRMAEAAEKQGDFAGAARLYAGVAKDFPLSDQADECIRNAEALRTLFPPSLGEEDLGKLSGILSAVASGSLPGERALEQTAQVLKTEYRSFDEADKLLEQALLSAPVERKHIVLFALGEVLLLEARRAAYLGRSDEAASLRGDGLRSFRDLVSQYSDTPLADDAKLELIRAELERVPANEREKRALTLYTEFLKEYPETDRFDEALFRRSEALGALANSPEDESAAEALSGFNSVIEDFPRSGFVPDARLRRGRMLCQQGNMAACEKDFEVVVEQFASSTAAPEAAYELGELKLAKRETGAAASLYTLASDKAGSRSLRERALARRGDCYLVAGDLARAIDEYEYVLERDPRGPFADDLLAKVAQAYLGRGRLAEASVPLQRLAREFPQSALLPGLMMRKAQEEEKAGDFAAAKATYDEIGRRYAQAGGDTSFVMGLGRASFRSGDFGLSLTAFERLLKMDASYELKKEAGRGAVLSLAKLGDESRLKRRLNWYLETFPEDSSVADEVTLERGLGMYRSGQYELAYSTLSSVEGTLPEPGRVNALVTMGLSKLKTGEFAPAADAFRAAVEADRGPRPDSSLAYTARFKLGSSLFAMSAFREAADSYLDAARFCRDSSQCCEAWYNGALCLERMEDWGGAADLYLKVSGGCAGKLGAEGAFKAGYCKLNSGDNREATALLTKALETSEESEKPEIQYWLGEAHAAAGDMERAAAEFLKVPYLYGEGTLWAVTARFKAGQAFEAAGNKDAAVRQYRAIVQREGEQSEWGSMAKERLLLLSK